ncbi:hypothetical protein D3C71_1592980 [compost metagenome]
MPSLSVLSVQAESVTNTWPRMEPCRWHDNSTTPAVSSFTSAKLAGLPSALPDRRSSKPLFESPALAGLSGRPAGAPRTWWSHRSWLVKRTVLPGNTTVTAGTKRIFSCSMVGLDGSRPGGAPAAAPGYTTTTASGTGLPSRSSTWI